MEKYIIEKQDSFNLKDIFECGQCFRWEKQSDGSYIGILKQGVVKVEEAKDEKGKYIFTGKLIDNSQKFDEVIREYFDLDTDYLEYKKILSNVDEYLKESIEFGSGIRIVKQDLWEMIISFIISANNNIPRIKKIIKQMSEKYGNLVEFEGVNYYTFPTVESLSKASVEDLRALGLGFRDKRIYETTKKVLNGQISLNKIASMNTTEEMREELLKLDGVGPKVADCILLFALKRVDVFPIDVWVRRVMNDLYIHNPDEEKVNKNQLQKLAQEKFCGLSGIAQQYLFYWKREN